MENSYEDVVYCKWHPKVETTLRCYQCNTPICVKCAQRTPVGYICPDCRKGRQKRFETAKSVDYIVTVVVALLLGAIAGIIPVVGWYVVFLSPLAGTLIAEVVWRLVGRRYSQHLWWIVAGGIIVGSLPLLIPTALSGIRIWMAGNAWGVLSVLWPILHIIMATGAATARLRLT